MKDTGNGLSFRTICKRRNTLEDCQLHCYGNAAVMADYINSVKQD